MTTEQRGPSWEPKTKLIYVGSPYSHQYGWIKEDRYQVVMKFVAKKILEEDYRCLFSPIIYTHVMACKFNLPKDFAFWKPLNDKILIKSDTLWVLRLSGWEKSEGLADEIKIATEQGKPIEYY